MRRVPGTCLPLPQNTPSHSFQSLAVHCKSAVMAVTRFMLGATLVIQVPVHPRAFPHCSAGSCLVQEPRQPSPASRHRPALPILRERVLLTIKYVVNCRILFKMSFTQLTKFPAILFIKGIIENKCQILSIFFLLRWCDFFLFGLLTG